MLTKNQLLIIIIGSICLLLRTTTAQISSNAILTSDRTTALTTHTPLQPLYLTYGAPPKPQHAYYDLTTFELHTNASIFTLRRLITNVKGKDKPEDKPGAVYNIHCNDCQDTTYIGETGRNLTTRLTEHK